MRVFILNLITLINGFTTDKNYPVTKVVNLLKHMQTTLEEETTKDKEVYEKFDCWCTTNDKEKTESIKVADESIAQLDANIEEFTATGARLTTEIKNLEEEVAKYQKALSAATAIREKEMKEMNAEEKDLIQSIQALKAAVVVLNKHHGGSLVSTNKKDKAVLDNVAAILKVKGVDVKALLSPSQRKVVEGFIQAPSNYQSYGSQSGEIYGILKNMKETFENNLSTSQKEELESQRLYKQLKEAKLAEIQASQDQIASKTEKKAQTMLSLSEAKQNLEDTTNARSSDVAFLTDLKVRCATTDKEWDQRQQARATEIAAVGKAISILSSDESRDMFNKAYNRESSFLQISNVTFKQRERAFKLLNTAAVKFNKPDLEAVATSARLDAFAKVKEAIDGMITNLQKEQKDEVKHKDWCTDSLFGNLQESEHTQRNIAGGEANIENLEADMKTLDGVMEVLTTEIKEIKKQVAEAGENRTAQNEDFKAIVAEQKEALFILQGALKVLQQAFAKPPPLVLTQIKHTFSGPPPPEGFESYKKNQNSNPVIAMIENIIHNTEMMIADVTRDEQSNQDAYTDIVNKSENSIKTKETSKINKSEVRAQKDMSKMEETSVLEKENADLKSLKSQEIDVHQSCDFVLKYFDVRQEARGQEIEALRQAIAILSGSDFAVFLEK